MSEAAREPAPAHARAGTASARLADSSRQPFRILSIDGGGVRGVFPAHILQRMEESFEIDLHDTFDMIAGTSTGAIIAAAVAARVPAKQVVGLYEEHGHAIFKRIWHRPGAGIVSGSRYPNQRLRRHLHDIFGDTRLGDIKKPLLLPATDIRNGCVHVLKSGYSDEFVRDKEVRVQDAVAASCSAPTYFDPFAIDSYLLADGGLWANNPAWAAVTDAKRRLGVEPGDIRILTLGTGHATRQYSTSKASNWALFRGWRGKRLFDLFLSLQSQSAHNYLMLHLGDEQFVRVSFESDKPLKLDKPSQIGDLITRADRSFTHESPAIKELLGI